MPERPIENCYWVVPDKLLAGEYPRNIDNKSSRNKLACLTQGGVSAFIDLTREGEMLPYVQWVAKGTHQRFPIVDGWTPDSPEITASILDAIDGHMDQGRTVYVHCMGGIGRTGTIIGCWLARHGHPGPEALARLGKLWQECPKSQQRHSPENLRQAQYVLDWKEQKMTTLRDRYRGCLMGLAAGDAVGTTVEFRPPGTFPTVTGMAGGGPFRLEPGQWTDDTSMALCLADSLVALGAFDPGDQMDRFLRWMDQGYLSSTGECFDVGITTSRSLRRYQNTGDPWAGSTDAGAAGNGSLMRLAPVPLFFARDPEQAIRMSGESSRTTHGARTCVDACRYFGGLILGALLGETKESLLSPRYSPAGNPWEQEPLCPEIDEVTAGSFKLREPPEIVGEGYVVRSLEAALWAFNRSETFEEGCLLAVNLGDDADTTAAIYGQLAGAFYGIEGIPQHWREVIAQGELIIRLADGLRESAR